MVNVRQRSSNNAGHTRREFRQLQQQQQDRDRGGGGGQQQRRRAVHRADEVVDEHGVPYVTGKVRSESPPTMSPWKAFGILLIARLCAAFWTSISDCDETFNYWEPTHYLLFGKGFQTWEYDPKYALRSYTYLLLHAVPAWFVANVVQPNKMFVFYFVRFAMAAACAGSETYFYVGVLQEIGTNVGRITFCSLLFSAGMFASSTAYLPSTTSMYLCMIAHGAWFQQSYALAIFATALSTYLSWPFAAVLGIPIAWDILLRKRKYLFFIKWCVISTFTILIPQIALDSDYYGKLSIPAFNIVKYNVLTNAGGPDLYGTEPWTYYLLNGILNFNVAFIAALLVWPLQGLLHLVVALPERSAQYLPISLSQLALYLWLSVFWMQPHKEERFLFPIYPLICLAAAMSIDAVQKLWFFAFVKVKVRHYLEHTTWISLVFLGVTSLLSLSRIVAVYQNYHAPMDIWMHINAMSSSPEYEPMLDKNVNFCVGKEWHRFPSSFFIPSESWQLRFLKSEFDGQLPQPFSDEPGATKLYRDGFNDQNKEDPTRYVKNPNWECDFIIDYENGKESQLEPIYSKNYEQWNEEFSVDFLDAPRSHRLFRALYIPFTRSGTCHFGKYVLLKNINKQRPPKRPRS